MGPRKLVIGFGGYWPWDSDGAYWHHGANRAVLQCMMVQGRVEANGAKLLNIGEKLD